MSGGPTLTLRRFAPADPGPGVAGLIRLEGVRPAGPVLLLVDASGSLAGGPLARAVALAGEVLERLDPARPAGVLALGATPGLLAPLAPARRLVPTLPGLLARAGDRARADLPAAVRLARAELARVHGPALAGAELVLLSDLLLEPAGLAAWRELAGEGARLHVLRVPTHLPDRPALEPDLTLPAEGPLAPAAEALLGALAAAPLGGLRLRLEAPPRRFFQGAPGAWRRGAPAGVAELSLPALPAAVGFLALPGARGEVGLTGPGAPPAVRFELDALEPLEEAWQAGLRELCRDA